MIQINGNKVFTSRFPDGTKQIKVDLYMKPVIRWYYESMDELFDLQCIKDKLDDLGMVNIVLEMPYVPNARMDKTIDPYECVTLKTFIKIINKMNFSKVRILDPHSVQCMGIRNLELMPVAEYVDWAICGFGLQSGTMYKPDVVLFFPDEGAKNRYADVLTQLSPHMKYTWGKKTRDYENRTVADVKIVNPEIITDKRVLIIDDICSKGGTFVRAYEVLREATTKDIGLYITHCEENIFRGAVLDLMPVYTTDSLSRGWKSPDFKKLPKINVKVIE